MLVCVTARLIPRRAGQRLPGGALREETERLMGRLLASRHEVDSLQDILVGGDAGDGSVTVRGVFTGDDETASLDLFTAYLRQVTTENAGPDEVLITYDFLEQGAERLDPSGRAIPADPSSRRSAPPLPRPRS